MVLNSQKVLMQNFCILIDLQIYEVYIGILHNLKICKLSSY